VQPLVVTRRASAVHASIAKSFSHFASLAVDAFAQAYIVYARKVSAFPRLHLEALRADPKAGAEQLLRQFALDTASVPTVLRDFHQFRRCTGNTTLEGKGGSADANTVLPPEQANGSTHPLLAEADALLGYGH
jgi:hypothetical protein